MKKQKDIIKIKLCTSCFNCKRKGRKIYCKLGVWEELDDESTILYTPYDFECPKWEES